MPEVSVIIPAYNRAAMLGDAVNSVLGQTFGDFELIVVDDGSTDDTPRLLGGLAGRVTALRTHRQGVAAARNHGAAAATGRYLAFLDSDDLWLPEKLKCQVAAHRAHPDLRISHTDEVWVRRQRRVNPMRKHAKRGGRIFRYSLPMCRISPSSVVLERSLFEEVGGFDRHFCVCEDYELWLRITARYPVLFLERRLTVKRGGHPDQLSAACWGLDRFRVKALVKLLGLGILDEGQRREVFAELERKAGILAGGYAARGKARQAGRYAGLAACAGKMTLPGLQENHGGTK
ncbi:MAG: glycosyltransferase family 2 protein [Candidatus Glassbacteria bacterium]|nr:glycosyltransferase family 2 protein [Candidatus Glassbacteria bacterium]